MHRMANYIPFESDWMQMKMCTWERTDTGRTLDPYILSGVIAFSFISSRQMVLLDGTQKKYCQTV